MWASQNDVSLLHFTVRSVRTGASFVLIKQGIFVGRNESNFGGENIELHTAPAPKDSSEDTIVASKELLMLPVGRRDAPTILPVRSPSRPESVTVFASVRLR